MFIWKRAFDILVSGSILVLGSPFILVVALLVRIKLGGPVLFTQERPGLGGEPFRMFKFRTMTSEVDASGEPLPDDERITPFGTTLRRTSLDELPELINVLKGEMSIVGPRPLLMEYLPLYSPAQARRHEVRPGVTGLAQVSGRNAIGWDAKFAYDIDYVERCSPLLDLSILKQTVQAVLSADGVNEAEMSAGATKFTG